jgi:hypothetical protein
MGKQPGKLKCNACGGYESIASVTEDGQFIVNCSMCLTWHFYRPNKRRAVAPKAFEDGILLRQITVSTGGVFHVDPECPNIDRRTSILWASMSDKALQGIARDTHGRCCTLCVTDISQESLLNIDNEEEDTSDGA